MLQHAELTLEERSTAAVTIEAFEDYLEWCHMDEAGRITMSLPLCLGWDMRRQFGAAGQALHRDLMYEHEPPMLGASRECYEHYLCELWDSYDRNPLHQIDELIVDAMSDARSLGWEAYGVDATETALDDLARRSGAKRAARDAVDAAGEAAERAVRDAEDAAEFAVYEQWLAAGEPANDPLAAEHRLRKLRIEHWQLMNQLPVLPAEIVDAYRRQSEHYAAAALGPLPDHPELPMHQAESLSRFWAHLPSGKIIYTPTRELWSSASADKHIGPIKDAMNPGGRGKLASTFLSQFRCVQSMGWDPSEPVIIEDRVLTQEGWITSKGDKTFNKYIPPEIMRVEGEVTRWLDHVRAVYPNEADHIISWCAHRVQRPGDKVNHALVFVGKEGIGKDTIIEPVVAAIGRTNFASITAQSFFKSDFNGYLKSVMLRIDEVHDLGGESKYAFHDRTKPIIAAPPSAHHINEKFVPHYVARNVCGVILTSNHLDALYLSPNDRRHFVCVSDKRKEDFAPGYFETMHNWFESGGNEAVGFYLANLDISDFKAKAPPRQTEGWHMLVNAGLAPESGDMADAIEALGKPAALTIQMIREKTPGDSQLRLLFEDAKQRKVIPKRLAECGYSVVVNPDARESGGRWRMAGSRVAIYGRQDIGEEERLNAARALATKSLSVPLPPPPR